MRALIPPAWHLAHAHAPRVPRVVVPGAGARRIAQSGPPLLGGGPCAAGRDVRVAARPPRAAKRPRLPAGGPRGPPRLPRLVQPCGTGSVAAHGPVDAQPSEPRGGGQRPGRPATSRVLAPGPPRIVVGRLHPGRRCGGARLHRQPPLAADLGCAAARLRWVASGGRLGRPPAGARRCRRRRIGARGRVTVGGHAGELGPPGVRGRRPRTVQRHAGPGGAAGARVAAAVGGAERGGVRGQQGQCARVPRPRTVPDGPAVAGGVRQQHRRNPGRRRGDAGHPRGSGMRRATVSHAFQTASCLSGACRGVPTCRRLPWM